MFYLLSKFSITNKFIFFLILTAVMPLLTAGYISYHAAKESLVESALKDQEHILSGYKVNFKLMKTQIESLISNISSVETINNILRKPSTETTAYNQLSLESQVGYILNSHLNIKGLVSIHVMAESGNHFQVGDTLDKRLKIHVKDDIRQAAISSSDEILWQGVKENMNASSSEKYVIVVSKNIFSINRDTGERSLVGIIVINYSIDQLDDFFEELIRETKIYLIDHNNRFVFHPNKNFIGQLSDEKRINYSAGEKHRIFEVNNEEVYQTFQAIRINSWVLLSEVSEKDILAKVVFIRHANVIVFALALFFVGIISIYFSNSFVAPLQHVINSFKRLNAGETEVEKLPVVGRDEMSQLAGWFNQFIDELERRHKSETALRLSDERYELVSRATNEGIWDVDVIKQEIYFSDRFKEIAGYLPGQMEESIDFFYKMPYIDDNVEIQNKIKKFLASDDMFINLEYRILKPSGDIVFISNNCWVVRDEKGMVTRMIGSIQDVSFQKELEDILRHDATHDALTGLHNRPWMLKRIDRELSEWQLYPDREFAVLFIDLDDFKQINDTLGHSVGDLLLVEVAKRIESCIRPDDSLARLGGDEFIILLTNITTGYVLQVADRLMQKTSEPYQLHHHMHESHFSLGVAFSSSGYMSSEEILRDADTAMYRAKASGKGNYEIFDNEMRATLLERASNERDLSQALQLQQLEMFFQPIHCLGSESVIGFESLIRWHHHSRIVTPDVFIPLAEENNYIHVLGAWIFEEVVKQISYWEADYELPDNFKVAVNISPKQFSSENMVEQMKKIIDQYQINPRHLTIELTETAIMRDRAAVLKSLERLKQQGISIHLDDFGTGFSSLSYLNEFPISAIKIDRSFVQKINSGDRDARMVDTIIMMAKELDIEVVAEGVEEKDQYQYLKDKACNFAQGYYIDRPLTAQAASDVLDLTYQRK